MEDYNVIKIIIVLISGMSIYLGYRLFYVVTERQGSLKLKGENSNIELSDVGPGVFFSFFGAAILIVSIVNQPYKDSNITTSENGVTTTTVREPASSGNHQVETLSDELQSLCLVDSMSDTFSEGAGTLMAPEWYKSTSPYKVIEKNELSELYSILERLEFPTPKKDTSDIVYIDYYYLLKAALYLNYTKYKC